MTSTPWGSPPNPVRVPGRLELSRSILIACAGILLAPSFVSVARAETTPVASPTSEEMKHARVEMDGAIAHMQSTSRYVRDMLRDARKRGTARQITCVDESLSRTDVAQRSARDEESEALAAYARDDLPSARASRVRVNELDLASGLAARDGTACLPQRVLVEKVATGTVVRVVVDPRIPRER